MKIAVACLAVTALTTLCGAATHQGQLYTTSPNSNGLGLGLKVEDFLPNRYTPGNVGLALSGGGSIALSNSLGVMRALHHLGLLDKVKVLSSVSGGSWASAPYTFLPDHISDDEFLGPLVEDPSRLHLTAFWSGSSDQAAQLDYMGPNCLGSVPPQHGFGVAAMVLEAGALYAKGVPAHRLWSHLIGKYVLGKFGLNTFDPSTHCPTHSFCGDEDDCNAAESANPNVRFHKMRKNRPLHLMNTAMFVRADVEDPSLSFDYLAPVQGTPFRTGILPQPAAKYTDGNGNLVQVGGGAVTSHAFGGSIKSINNGVLEVEQTCPFGLSDIVGASSAAFAEKMQNEIKFLASMDPVFNYFAPAQAVAGAGSIQKFSDGGTLENSGIASMLQYEDVDSIISVLYMMDTITKQPDGTIKMDNTIGNLFGYKAYDSKHGWVRYPSQTSTATLPNKLASEFRFDQVFDESQFDEMLQGLYDATTNQGTSSEQSGPAVFLQQNLRVVDNPWWGIRGGRTVNVVWVYVTKASDWTEQLSTSVRLSLITRRHFPQINFFDTGIDATTVNLISHFTSWMVMQNKHLFEALFDPSGPAAFLDATSSQSSTARGDDNSDISILIGALAGTVVVALAAVAIILHKRRVRSSMPLDAEMGSLDPQ